MKSFIAALRSLVLPFGATTGARIVLDGVNGRIEVYNGAGVRIGVLDGTTGFKFTGTSETFQIDTSGRTYIREVPDVGAYLELTAAAGFGGLIFFQPENSSVPGLVFFPASFFADAIESGGVNSQPKLQIISPYVTGAPNKASSQVVLFGQTNTSATDNSKAEIDAGEVEFNGVGSVNFNMAQFNLNSTRFSRDNGLMSITVGGGGIPTGVVTAIVLANTAIISNSYGICNSGGFLFNKTGQWEIGITVRWQSQNPVVGIRMIRMQVNGVDYYYQTVPPTTAMNGTLVTTGFTIRDNWNIGDFITFQAFQNSGVGLTIGNNSRAWAELIEG